MADESQELIESMAGLLALSERMQVLLATEERMQAAAEASGVMLIQQGIAQCVACAPVEMTGEQVAAAANEQTPWEVAGSSLRWAVSETPFADDTNPGRCGDEPGVRQHWLLSC